MSIFTRRNKVYKDDDEEFEQLEVKDLKPENRKKRKEVSKPWGKKERYTVLTFLVLTVFISGILSAGSTNWKLSGFPQIKLPTFKGLNFDFLNGKTIIIGKPFDPDRDKQEERADKIKKGFSLKTKSLSGIYAFYVVELSNGYSFGKNEEDLLTAASLIKLPVLATLYMEADAGTINLDDKPEGSGQTFRQLAQEMGKKSSNEAQLAALKVLGKDKIQVTIDKLGMKNTSYLENKTTPKDIGIFFQKLWTGQVVTEKSRDEILGYLTDTIYEDWIKKGIPEVRVAHKYGREVHVVSDAGIVYSDKPFVLVIMSQGVVDKEADLVIPEIAAFVYNELK